MGIKEIMVILFACYLRKAYAPEYLKGYLSVFNISALIEPNGEKIGTYHKHVVGHLKKLVVDPSVVFEKEVYDPILFQRQCETSTFVMLGFLKVSRLKI